MLHRTRRRIGPDGPTLIGIGSARFREKKRSTRGRWNPMPRHRFDISDAAEPAVPDAATYAAFLTAVLAMQLVPGPEAMLVLGRGVGQGRKVALWNVLGMTLVAGVIQLPLLALGIASVLRSSPFAFALLRWLGAGYLVWLGVRLLLARGRGPSAGNGAGPGAPQSAFVSLREGLLANLTNPYPQMFMLAFLPQFVDPSRGPVALQLLLFGATQKLTGFAVLGTTALAAGTVGGWLARWPELVIWQQRFAGAVMVALGLRLLAGGGGSGR